MVVEGAEADVRGVGDLLNADVGLAVSQEALRGTDQRCPGASLASIQSAGSCGRISTHVGLPLRMLQY